MAQKRTPEEWQALIRELRKITDSPKETKERKRKAQNILDSIFNKRGPLSYTEAMRRKEGQQRTTAFRHTTDEENWGDIV